MWRKARPKDDPAIVELCLKLDAEDPGPVPISAANTSKAVALTLEVRQDNRRARRLYRRLGFRGDNVVMHRRLRTR